MSPQHRKAALSPSLASLCLAAVSLVACSSSSSPPASQTTGGQVAGGSGAGGAVSAGGSGQGGATTGAGGTTTGSGGRVTGTGGGTGGRTGAGGGAGGDTTGPRDAASTDGNTPGSGGNNTGVGGSGIGAGGSTGQDAGLADGRGQGGAIGTGGSTAAPDSGAGGGASDGGATSAGCGKSVTRPNPRTQQTISIGGTTRYYLLDVPTASDNKTPLMLIFALHGYDMNNVSVVGLFNFTSRSNGKAITVYPQGEGPAPGDTSHWGDNVLKSTWTANDANYNFIRTLMTDLESSYCIDTSRVFITGFSMGGMFTNSMACDHNDWFRGYAPVEGMGPGSCANADAKPAIIIHQGTGDTLVTPSKGGEPTRDFWAKQNGCNQTTTATFTGCQSFGACAQPVAYCVGNWDHTITSTAAANIWSFFNGLP